MAIPPSCVHVTVTIKEDIAWVTVAILEGVLITPRGRRPRLMPTPLPSMTSIDAPIYVDEATVDIVDEVSRRVEVLRQILMLLPYGCLEAPLLLERV